MLYTNGDLKGSDKHWYQIIEENENGVANLEKCKEAIN
jgi:hypothetical protein